VRRRSELTPWDSGPAKQDGARKQAGHADALVDAMKHERDEMLWKIPGYDGPNAEVRLAKLAVAFGTFVDEP
jgi:hypothetical protein